MTSESSILNHQFLRIMTLGIAILSLPNCASSEQLRTTTKVRADITQAIDLNDSDNKPNSTDIREVHGCEIVGSKEFKLQVENALNLIKNIDIKTYELVLRYVDRIAQSQRSGMDVERKVILLSSYSCVSNLWLSSAIVHDASHSKLYWDYVEKHGLPVPYKIYTYEDAELECIEKQIDFLRHSSDQYLRRYYIKYLLTQNGRHYDADNNGIFDNKDKRNQWW